MSATFQSHDGAEAPEAGLDPYQANSADFTTPDSVTAAADQPYRVRTRQREDFAASPAAAAQQQKPASPVRLTAASWKYSLKRTLKEFGRDQCTDLAAGLTYYAVLSVFPAMIAFVSILSIVGEAQRTQEFLLDMLSDMIDGDLMSTVENMVAQVTAAPGAGLGLIIGILAAIWTASNYVNAFSRAMNRILGTEEGRSALKLRPVLYAVTVSLIVLMAAAAVMLVVSGPLAEAIGSTIGLGEAAVTAWNTATPVVLLLVAAAAIAMLYYFTPNIRQPGVTWISVGALLAIVVMIITTVGVGFYVSNFANYEATYGALAGIIIFLFWIYIMNLVLLLGAEFNAELERARQLQAGIPAERTLMLAPRTADAAEKADTKYQAMIAQATALRMSSGRTSDPEQIWRE